MASSTIRVGDYHVGVRSRTTAADRLVRELFAAHLVDDPDAPPNFSLQLAPAAAPGVVAQPLHRLFDGHAEVARHRDPRRVLRALVGYLSRFAPPDPDVVRLRAMAMCGPGGAVLLPDAWRRRAAQAERRLRREGTWVVDGPHVWLDVRTGQLLVPEPVRVNLAAMEAVSEVAAAPLRPLPPPPTGPRPLRGWLVDVPADAPPPTRAATLVAAMRRVRNIDVVGGRRAFEVLAGCLESVAVVPASRDLTDSDAAAMVAELLIGGR